MSNRILVTTRKGVFIVARGESGWAIQKTAFLGDTFSIAMQDPRDGALYACFEHGHFGVKVHRSDDDGDTWSEVATPAFPEKPDDPDDKNPWKLTSAWSLESAGPDKPGELWMGTIPGGLFHSKDRGDSWQLVESLWNHPKRKVWFGGGSEQPGLHSICVDPRNSDRVLIGVSCGGAWLTEDGGDSWVCKADGMRAEYMPPEQAMMPEIQDPHLIVQCRDEPDTYWCQHHNGVFVSTDGADSWQELDTPQPSVFGFAVAVHPADGKTAWFVPAIKDEKRIPVDGKVVVSRTRDGGETFEVLRDGLPQEHGYDLTFRHAFDVCDEGQRLVFGSTTGALWVSEDQGDSWVTISAHLPQIYSVCFID